ncbi:UbiH/UbiF family hydroxylase [Pseudohoeflea suaedae]|uniref:UbiH/UbiF family hydroxylase n=1 Tax=Pseudohoeflea suaedae TaxID=877384 RepID=A0A4R5PRN2_9HYPH|nr:UbiH/UbiF family hydroxylase [Pseudohoeflea suaedae]TDH39513.1 UbiH/UbiF family hydroxylase [Pseudohoeflea suaedae]
MDEFDIAVVGGGLAGTMAALAAAAEGWSVAFIAPPPPGNDRRTTALMTESIEMLSRLGVWDEVRKESAALSTMRILDGTKRLFRAPPVSFQSSEIDLPAFGYNIPNKPLMAAATARVEAVDAITRIPQALAEAHEDGGVMKLTLEDGTLLTADAIIAADGRKSKARECAGISAKTWSYRQTAVVLNFTHQMPHNNISTEFHTEAGPFTQVPLPGNRSSLVWAMDPDEVEDVMNMEREELNARVEGRMSSILGAVEVEDGYQAWPMSSMIAQNFARGRTFLIGETAHAFPPIGAQGLNLSLRDVEMAISRIRDVGGPAKADAAALSYDRARRSDVSSRTFGVDLLNRTLLSSFLPAQMLRAGGLAVLDAIKPLKMLAMREGMTPGWRKRSILPNIADMAADLRKKVSR